MKNIKVLASWQCLGFLILAIWGVTSVGAAEKAKPVAPVISVAEPAKKKEMGLGLASVDGLSGTNSAIAGFYTLNDSNAIRVFLGLPSTSPFQFTVSGLFDHNVATRGNASFHVGGGAGLGILGDPTTDFALSVVGNLGVRYKLENTPIFVGFDGGPGFQLVGGNSDFRVGALSPILGASVIYVF